MSAWFSDKRKFIKPWRAHTLWLARSFPLMLRFHWLILAWVWAQPLYAQVGAHILLQDSSLAGFQYHAGKKLWPQMQVGDALTLVREPDNVHDAKAVRVEWQGHKIGYVPRRENADVARFMDGGQMLVARINRLAEVRDPWSRVRFEILVPVQPTGQGVP
ncbi:MAG: HIRAN domain-containing protein [Thiobacillus sp.]|nr:HIRAN domain-containing protein [Thiobacillus sp.]